MAAQVADLASATAEVRRANTAPSKRRWSRALKETQHHTPRANIKDRLKRADSKRTLVAENAKYARTVLEEFAAISRPKYKVRDAMLFGTFIDFFMLLRIPIGNTLTRALIRHGGPEQLRFLFCVATFDSDHNGYIDDKEWALYEKVGDALIADSVAMCANMGIVGALLLGLTHLVTIGRPLPFELSEPSAAFFDSRWLVWVSYTFNAASEAAAFFTLAIAVITRNNLTNVLPTRELKIDMLRSSNALGIMGVGLMLTLWCFILSTAFGTLVASPKEGFVGTGLFAGCTLMCIWFVAPIRYMAVLLLHEEVKRFLLDKSGSFLKQALNTDPRLASSFAQTVQRAREARAASEAKEKAGGAPAGSGAAAPASAASVLARAGVLASSSPPPGCKISFGDPPSSAHVTHGLDVEASSSTRQSQLE